MKSRSYILYGLNDRDDRVRILLCKKIISRTEIIVIIIAWSDIIMK